MECYQPRVNLPFRVDYKLFIFISGNRTFMCPIAIMEIQLLCLLPWQNVQSSNNEKKTEL